MSRLPSPTLRALLPLALALASGCLLDDPVDPLGPAPSGDDHGEADGPALVLRVAVDPDAPRLNNLGLPAPMAEGHAGQDPVFHRIGIHHAELVPNALTPVGVGAIALESPHTMAGGDLAVDFDEQPVIAPGEEIVGAVLADLPPGTYEYLRIALSFQEYDVDLEVDVAGQPLAVTGRVASFLELSTYIRDYELDGETVTVNGNRAQGYWAFKTPYTSVIEGQAPAGATTVPNPIDSTSPVGVGSCIVTAAFDEPLTITGDEREDLVVDVSLSIDRSFEWIDGNGDGVWQPLQSEAIVDMGVRGMTLAVE